ncbi:hypothetical protein HYALB_00001460 [Hymenoscyphus albidus]|uniref:N-acetyltransferase domain-containing protein n=1 Tax=Hymenoscyphus albidus TaxID=595503 RepID=A0A9N9PQG3_9HELO|nr:hypothetical protein HYALB_00001460 [Hymenoscyphus albidus]
MPRDLHLEQPQPQKQPSQDDKPGSPPTLSESPNRMSGPSSPEPESSGSKSFSIVPHDQQYRPTLNLHPLVRPLTISDLGSVVALENGAFVEESERATREKIEYRLSKCGELCSGLFTTVVPGPQQSFSSTTLSSASPVETSRKNGAVSVLLGHVVATKTTSPLATDESMDFPKDWKSASSAKNEVGHMEMGRTIVLHSVTVTPEFQERGLGGVLMKAYISSMAGSGVADRLVLIAHDHKVGWYEKLGFVSQGKSKVQFGGGNWIDMVYELKKTEPRARYG